MSNHYGLIYKVTNINNNKVYIGQTTKDLTYRKHGHKYKAFSTERKSIFYNAIRKHGWNAFTWEVLGYCSSKKELDNAERRCIEFFHSTDKRYGYNSTQGGDGLQEPVEKVLEKLRESGNKTKGRIPSEKTRKKITKGLNEYYATHDGPNKGREFSEESKQRMSEAQQKIWTDPVYREKMKRKRKEVWQDEEHRAKMQKANKEKMTDELREKFSKLTSGSNNPRAKKVMIDGVIYDCIKDASDALGIGYPSLYGKLWRYKDKGNFPDGWGFID